MPTKLDADQIKASLERLPNWRLEGDRLLREYRFADFRQAMAFMQSCVEAAEGLNHHPEWSNVYNRVKVALTTHDVGGLSESDFSLAARMEELADQQGA